MAGLTRREFLERTAVLSAAWATARPVPAGHITVAGVPFPVPGALRVVHAQEPEGLAFAPLADLWGHRRWRGQLVDNLGMLDRVVRLVVLHADQTTTSRDCYRVLCARGLSTHFLVDWDGTVYQALDPVSRAFHARGFNDVSIGIDLNNRLAPLPLQGPLPSYASLCTPPFPPGFAAQRRPVGTARIHGHLFRAHGYTEAQLDALRSLLDALVAALPSLAPEGRLRIPLDPVGAVLEGLLPEPDTFTGLVAHWHLSEDRWDPGPAFAWERVGARAGAGLAAPVRVRRRARPTNLHDELAAVERLAQAPPRGQYPVTRTGRWHGGVHLELRRGARVCAPLAGRLVAARMAAPLRLGSANFALLRHAVRLARDDSEDVVVFYWLAMHLAPVPPSRWRRCGIGWLERLARRARRMPPALAEPRTDGRGGDAFEQLAAGAVVVFDEDDDALRVAAGECVGLAGPFGPRGGGTRGVHLEAFAKPPAKGLLAVGDGRWTLVEAPASSQGPTLGGGVEAPPFDEAPHDAADWVAWRRWWRRVEARAAPRKALGRLVVVSPSEWSDHAPWLGRVAGSHAQGGASVRAWLAALPRELRRAPLVEDLAQATAFAWLTRSVALRLDLASGASWDGRVAHVHPLALLEALRQRVECGA